ncbi:MAG: hypothetical protein NZ930_00070 [Candidatus Bipolaricaulota bacterium]|nr:hypothetical protein [Candidatus Bipolaricaulota bacterium]MDW8031100.1 hypothetical protein [Candidatus Bipolaricaulota bacterium]
MRQILTSVLLILGVVVLAIQVAEAISQDAWGKARRATLVLALMSVAVFLFIIPTIWSYYLKKEAIQIWTFNGLAFVAIAALAIAWRLLARVASP